MIVSYNWLKEYVKIPWSALKLAEKLTGSSFPVDRVENLGEKWQSILVGLILKMEKHPQISSLLTCEVATGKETVKLVCGASNIEVGDKIPLALPGTVLPDGKRIEKAPIHGVDSTGMLCSEAELELGTDTTGIMILNPKVKIGQSLTQALDLEDWLLELDITPNRPDCLSIYGVAREISALSGQPLKKIDFKLKESREPASKYAQVSIEKQTDCPRYLARVIRNVKIGPSPAWLARKLYSVGQRPINNVVDITNSVMLELGQPLHAFDYDKLAHKKILVRRAKEGEEFVTLDGVKRKLSPDVLLITDKDHPVALAGIMGGQESEVSNRTTNILLESAYFAPQRIRQGRKLLGLATEASTRFEKGADPDIVDFAANRATALMGEIAGGEILKGAVDKYPRKITPKTIVLKPERVNQLLETKLSTAQMSRIFKSLKFSVQGKQNLKVTVPTFRPDITQEADLIEEIARIYGYDNIPTAVQNKGVLEVFESEQEKFFSDIKNRLVGWGFQEIVTDSLVDPQVLENFGYSSAAIAVLNPITNDHSVLRTNLAVSMLPVILVNQNRKQPDLKLFEIGKVYWKDNGQPRENYRLCIAVTGSRQTRSWGTRPEPVDFFDLKGVIQALSESFGISDLKFSPMQSSHYSSSLSFAIQTCGKNLGSSGLINRAILDRLDIKNEVFLAEIDLTNLATAVGKDMYFKPLPKYPPVERDIAVIVDKSLLSEQIVVKIKDWAGGLAEEVGIFDVYSGKQVPADKKSLAFYIRYRSAKKTLTEEEVNTVQNRIVQNLEREFNAQLRS
jgi:phenylalanyl-tRNA synthetase beta chain